MACASQTKPLTCVSSSSCNAYAERCWDQCDERAEARRIKFPNFDIDPACAMAVEHKTRLSGGCVGECIEAVAMCRFRISNELRISVDQLAVERLPL